ncbi:hypothetical protein SAMN05443582_10831 [Phyllobacterium sp. OV277]|jgi:DNA-binding MarR family transcriptional regulator|nr:hypothetical protein SAMN05443582_10831 [Phyllobacterium sp. OV277]
MVLVEHSRSGMRAIGLTLPRAKALWEISHRESVTQRELADALKSTPRNITTLMSALWSYRRAIAGPFG